MNLLTLKVWECACGYRCLRRVDAYDPQHPDPPACPGCGQPWVPERVVAHTRQLAPSCVRCAGDGVVYHRADGDGLADSTCPACGGSGLP